MSHWVSETCKGEHCRCGQPATHKVGEEIASDARAAIIIHNPESGQHEGRVPEFYQNACRHNLTVYVCCAHFCEIMGLWATKACFPGRA